MDKPWRQFCRLYKLSPNPVHYMEFSFSVQLLYSLQAISLFDYSLMSQPNLKKTNLVLYFLHLQTKMNEFKINNLLSWQQSIIINRVMYRQSNQRYSDSTNMNNLPPINTMNPYLPPPHLQPPKMHMQAYNPSLPPPPIYNDPNQNINNYEYPPNYLPPLTQNYDRSFPPNGWRQMSQPKGPIMPGSMGPPPPSALHNLGNVSVPMHYDVRAMSASNNDFQQVKPQNQTYMVSGGQVSPQMNIVQRLSGIIKSQLNVLQGIMRYTEKKSTEEKQKRERSRSRSRQHRDRGSRRPDWQKQHREWNCGKCSFLNFDFRDRCKRCNQPKNESSRSDRYEGGVGGGKNYVPGPEDWRCLKCSNINYARRTECHRCHTARGK